MLDRYAATFAALPAAASARVWAACLDRYPGRMPAPNGAGTGGAALHAACAAAGIYQAEVVMSVADARDPPALAALEVFVGHPVRYEPRSDPAATGARCNFPNCRCAVAVSTPTVAPTVCPLDLPVPEPAPEPPAPAAPAARVPTRAPSRRDPRVVLTVQPNPRKPGTAAHAGYACWIAGDTVDQCLARGLPARYVRKDVRKGRVTLGPVPR